MSQGFPPRHQFDPAYGEHPQLQPLPPRGQPDYRRSDVGPGPMPVRMSGAAAWIPVIILILTAVNAYLTNRNTNRIEEVHGVAATAAFRADEAAETTRDTNAEVKATRAHLKAALPAPKPAAPREP